MVMLPVGGACRESAVALFAGSAEPATGPNVIVFGGGVEVVFRLFPEFLLDSWGLVLRLFIIPD